MTSASSRAWCLTINNYNDSIYQAVTSYKTDYLIVGKEIGESGTPHLQIYFYKNTKITFNGLKKTFPTAHIEQAKGTPQQNQTYCSKEGNFFELGTLPQQGNRTDLKKLVESILSKETKIDQLIVEDPIAYHQYGRTLEKIEALQKRKQFRTKQTTCEWIYGASGVGKSYEAYINYSPETHYNHQEDGLWWDNYDQQEIVIINEFRGEIKYKRLLELADKTPCNVPQRNKAPCPFTSRHIIITSSKSPEEIYTYLGDNMEQLYRRITIRHKQKLPYLEQVRLNRQDYNL